MEPTLGPSSSEPVVLVLAAGGALAGDVWNWMLPTMPAGRTSPAWLCGVADPSWLLGLALQCEWKLQISAVRAGCECDAVEPAAGLLNGLVAGGSATTRTQTDSSRATAAGAVGRLAEAAALGMSLRSTSLAELWRAVEAMRGGAEVKRVLMVRVDGAPTT